VQPAIGELKFNIDNHLVKAIEKAQTTARDLIASNEHVVLQFNHYGADLIKVWRVDVNTNAYTYFFFLISTYLRSHIESKNESGWMGSNELSTRLLQTER
jgi:acetolactate synthase small subunit